jgi:hypothetical protein
LKIANCFVVSLFLIIASPVFSSSLPCSEWEVLVSEHEVQAYERKDGTPVKGSRKNEHCRNKFPQVKDWKERFTNKKLSEWPFKEENFKSWSQLEKEIVLKALQKQPEVFRKFKNITFLRGVRSRI